MIHHILKIIRNERRYNAGIWLELFVVSAFLWYIVDYSFVIVSNYLKPLNFDIEHTYIIQFGHLNNQNPGYVEESEGGGTGETVFKILERVRLNPMIEAASFSRNSSPHIGSNTSGTLYHDTINTEYQVLRRMVTSDFFRVFRYKSVDGSTDKLVAALEKGEYVISQRVAKELFPGVDAVGKEVSFSKDEDAEKYRVGAVSTDIRYDNFSYWDMYIGIPMTASVLNEYPKKFITWMELCVRVKPDEDRDFINRFRDQMTDQLRIGNLYLNTINSIPANKKIFQLDDMNDLKMRMFILFFLLINIFLGITGTFWFRTQHRRGEIGVRIAMGNTPRGLLRAYYIEGLLLLTLAMLPVMVMFASVKSFNILYSSWNFGVVRYLVGFGITYVLLAAMIVAGIWFPARKATGIMPAEALHDE